MRAIPECLRDALYGGTIQINYLYLFIIKVLEAQAGTEYMTGVDCNHTAVTVT